MNKKRILIALLVLLAALGISAFSWVTLTRLSVSQAGSAAYYPSSSWVEPHQAAAVSYYRGSDWIERHPSIGAESYYKGSDWIERHPSFDAASYYKGSDWFERHSIMFLGSSSTRMDYSLEKHVGEGGK